MGSSWPRSLAITRSKERVGNRGVLRVECHSVVTGRGHPSCQSLPAGPLGSWQAAAALGLPRALRALVGEAAAAGALAVCTPARGHTNWQLEGAKALVGTEIRGTLQDHCGV